MLMRAMYVNDSNVIWPVQSCSQKFFAFHAGQITPSPPRLTRQEGRIAIVTNARWDALDAAASGAQRNGRAGWRKACELSKVRRRTALKRTAKPCGPGTRCWCQVGGGASARPGLDNPYSPTTVTK